MKINFGGTKFDQLDYDEVADVLYMSVSGVEPVAREESPEGHVLRFDADGSLCGVTIIGMRKHLDEDNHIRVTVPRAEELGVPRELVPA